MQLTQFSHENATHPRFLSFLLLLCFFNPVAWPSQRVSRLHGTLSEFRGPAARVERKLRDRTPSAQQSSSSAQGGPSRAWGQAGHLFRSCGLAVCGRSLLAPPLWLLALLVGCPEAQTLTFPFHALSLSLPPRFYPFSGSVATTKHIQPGLFP